VPTTVELFLSVAFPFTTAFESFFIAPIRAAGLLPPSLSLPGLSGISLICRDARLFDRTRSVSSIPELLLSWNLTFAGAFDRSRMLLSGRLVLSNTRSRQSEDGTVKVGDDTDGEISIVGNVGDWASIGQEFVAGDGQLSGPVVEFG